MKNRFYKRFVARPVIVQQVKIAATVTGSLYSTAMRAHIPLKLVRQMTNILAWRINFSKEVRSGDHFSMVYETKMIDHHVVAIGDLIAVAYKKGKQSVYAIYYKSRHGVGDYYSETGNSFKKAFDRYPIRFTHISSNFSLARYHPILKYYRAHKGVDLAASMGTPIHATGDGRIVFIGRQGAYGNMIEIKHDNKFSTIYGHMLRFQRGLGRNSSVKRGQIIGYVGQSGLASGPHCHYELHVNNQAKDPATVLLPTSFPLVGRELRAFKAKARIYLAKL